MPQRCQVDRSFDALLLFQDHVVHRDTALSSGLTARAITHRLGTGRWRKLLPSVYLTYPGEPTRRQMLVAALLYAGEEAAIDAADACRFHGVKAVGVSEDQVRVVVPWGSAAGSRGFVVVRRTVAPITVVATDLVRYVDPAAAVIAATRLMTSHRPVLAALSDALQRRTTSYDDLVRAHVQGPPRNARLADDALDDLGAGTRSVPESDFRHLVLASSILPAVDYNAWLRLPDGRIVCVDALIEPSAVIHETNGRIAHEREDLFEDMQERGDALTTAGFTVLNNAPSRIRLRGREVIAQVERCHQMHNGCGLPPEVRRIAMADSGGSTTPNRPRG
jgi:hypothetical protein